MSSNSAKHRKSKRAPSRNTPSRNGTAARSRHRKPSPITSAIQAHPTKTAAAVTGAVLIAAAAPALTHWSGDVGIGQAATLHQGDPLALNRSAAPGLADRYATAKPAPQASMPRAVSVAAARAKGKHHRTTHPRPQSQPTHRPSHHRAPPPVYANPLRAVSGLVPERVDQGVDFGGTGPVYAIGDGVVTDVYNGDAGWPGGGWVSYRLTDGPAVGLTAFVAEDVTPTVSVGQAVSPDTVICNMFNGGAGIETGWAWPGHGDTAESQSPQAGGIAGSGPFPTDVGVNFDELLQALGVPAGPNRYDTPSGILPAGYPTDWLSAAG